MKFRWPKFVILNFSLIIFGVSCNKSLSDLNWEADVNLPLIHSVLDLKDIFGDTLAIYNPDQTVSLIINHQISTIDNNTLIEVQDTIAKDIFNIPFNLGLALPPGQEIINGSSAFKLELNETQIRFATAKVAELKFAVTNTFKERLLVEYEVISSNKNGKSFVVVEEVPAATSNGPAHVIKTIDLAGYFMDFTGVNKNDFNIVLSKTIVKIHPDADTVFLMASDSIIVTTIFNKLQLDYLKGYFGQFSQTIMDSSSLNTFSKFKSGYFDFDKVKARFDISNGIGADVQLKINRIFSANSLSMSAIDLQHDLIGKNINIVRAFETGNISNPVSPSVYSWDLSNSNLKQIIVSQPDILGFNMEYKFNPLGNISGGNDFLYSSHTLHGNIFMEIPLKVRLDSLVIEELTTIDFSAAQKINSGKLLILTENYFPFEVGIQFYILNDNNVIIDSLIQGNITAQPGLLNIHDVVLNPTHNQMIIPLSESKLALLKSSKNILVRSRIHSQLPGKIQLYEHYNIDIKVVLKAEYEF